MGTKYSKEFKEDALRLAAGEGVAAASEKLGIAKRQIYEWRRDQRQATVRVPKGMQPGETLEECCHRLEKECYPPCFFTSMVSTKFHFKFSFTLRL